MVSFAKCFGQTLGVLRWRDYEWTRLTKYFSKSA